MVGISLLFPLSYTLDSNMEVEVEIHIIKPDGSKIIREAILNKFGVYSEDQFYEPGAIIEYITKNDELISGGSWVYTARYEAGDIVLHSDDIVINIKDELNQQLLF